MMFLLIEIKLLDKYFNGDAGTHPTIKSNTPRQYSSNYSLLFCLVNVIFCFWMDFKSSDTQSSVNLIFYFFAHFQMMRHKTDRKVFVIKRKTIRRIPTVPLDETINERSRSLVFF